jgi:hypothetical protein
MYRIFLTLFLAAMLVACGGGASEKEVTDSKALLKEAFNKTQTQNSVRMTQSVKIEADAVGVVAETQQEIAAELTRAYIKATDQGKTTEVAIDGSKAWVREGGGPWTEVSTRELGIDPSNLRQGVDISKLVYEVEQSRTRDGGKDLVKLHTTIDTLSLKDHMDDLVPRGSPMASVLRSMDIYTYTSDYFIDVSSRLIQRAATEYEFFYQHQHAKAKSDIRYVSFNEPVKLPSDLPR